MGPGQPAAVSTVQDPRRATACALSTPLESRFQRARAALGLALLCLSAFACDRAAEGRGPDSLPGAATASAPAPSAQARAALPWLEAALGAAGSLPAEPHRKTRARLQEDVVRAAIELDLPAEALDWSQRIEGWRRGAVLAELAAHEARAERRDAAQRIVELARQEEARAEQAGLADPSAQTWQRERVRARIAEAGLALGNGALAEEYGAGLGEAEAALLAGQRARSLDAEGFQAELEQLDAEIATKSFDRARGALESLIVLQERFGALPERRALLEQRLEQAWKCVPAMVQIDSLARLAQVELSRGDRDAARVRIEAAQAALGQSVWTPENRVPREARLAELWFGVGEVERAGRELEQALARFEEQRSQVVDIYRAGVLRPLAEGWLALGERTRARALYLRTLEEGLGNPNSRPRAEDLVATAVSLAVHGYGDDAELLARLRHAIEGLGEPW